MTAEPNNFRHKEIEAYDVFHDKSMDDKELSKIVIPRTIMP